MGKTDGHIHQQLSRSFSFDSPMDFQRTSHTMLPTFQQITTPKMRYSLNQQRLHNEKTNRFSLDQSQMSKDSTGFRISTRSSCSIAEYDSQSRNNEQIEQEIQNDIRRVNDIFDRKIIIFL